MALPELDGQVRAAIDRGYGVGIHAMGNVALDATLDVETG